MTDKTKRLLYASTQPASRLGNLAFLSEYVRSLSVDDSGKLRKADFPFSKGRVSMLSTLQKRTAQAIVNIYETSRIYGDYGKVTLTPGDSGHLSYGKIQATLTSGNLYLLIKSYCETEGARFAEQMRPYLEQLADRDTTLDYETPFRDSLREAGDDPIMRSVQDGFSDRVFWEPARAAHARFGFETALGVSVVYDSFIHGSWEHVRNLTGQDASDMGEAAWISKYVQTRRHWLANHPKTQLHATVYRMDTFSRLIDDGNWNLELPLYVLGLRIDESALSADPSSNVSAESRSFLRLQMPYMIGDEVTAVQEALKHKGFEIDVDGIYGPLTQATVRLFQQQEGLVVDGIVGPVTRTALGL